MQERARRARRGTRPEISCPSRRGQLRNSCILRPGRKSRSSRAEDTMRCMTRSQTGIALLALLFLTWGTQTDRDVVGAQTRAPIMATRIYTGTDGQSHAEE